MWNFLNANSGSIQAITTVILVLVTAAYVVLTWINVRTIQKAEVERNRPRVILYIQQREESFKFVDLIIGNYGHDVASDIMFDLSEDLELIKKGETLSSIGIIKNGIKNIVPHQELRIPLIFVPGRLEELRSKNIVITVTYKDSVGKRTFSEEFPIDFNSLIEHQLGIPPIYEISKNLEKIANVLENKFRK